MTPYTGLETTLVEQHGSAQASIGSAALSHVPWAVGSSATTSRHHTARLQHVGTRCVCLVQRLALPPTASHRLFVMVPFEAPPPLPAAMVPRLPAGSFAVAAGGAAVPAASTAELLQHLQPCLDSLWAASGILRPDALTAGEISLLGLKYCSPVLLLLQPQRLRVASAAGQPLKLQLLQPWLLKGEKKTLHLLRFQVDDWDSPIATGELLLNAAANVAGGAGNPLTVSATPSAVSVNVEVRQVRLTADTGGVWLFPEYIREALSGIVHERVPGQLRARLSRHTQQLRSDVLKVLQARLTTASQSVLFHDIQRPAG